MPTIVALARTFSNDFDSDQTTTTATTTTQTTPVTDTDIDDAMIYNNGLKYSQANNRIGRGCYCCCRGRSRRLHHLHHHRSRHAVSPLPPDTLDTLLSTQFTTVLDNLSQYYSFSSCSDGSSNDDDAAAVPAAAVAKADKTKKADNDIVHYQLPPVVCKPCQTAKAYASGSIGDNVAAGGGGCGVDGKRRVPLRRKLSTTTTKIGAFIHVQKLAVITISLIIAFFIGTRTLRSNTTTTLVSSNHLHASHSTAEFHNVESVVHPPNPTNQPLVFDDNDDDDDDDRQPDNDTWKLVLPSYCSSIQTKANSFNFVSLLSVDHQQKISNEEEILPPFIAKNVFAKFYALGFLCLLFGVSFVCEKLFGCKIIVQHADCLSDDEDDDDDDDDVDDDDEDSDLKFDLDEYDQQIKESISFENQNQNFNLNLETNDQTLLKKIAWTEVHISVLYFLPLRLISRIWGYLNAIPLPRCTRATLYLWYSKTFGCNLDELNLNDKPLEEYRNLSEFFRRQLRPGVRPIGTAELVSPADGRVVQFEPIDCKSSLVGSVKGIHYSVENFLGPQIIPKSFQSPNHTLYSCVIYLAPGDYHRFHSPANWVIHSRRHFSGRLFSVKPNFVAMFPNLFSIQERVSYFGHWKYGFFSMTAVGATNVGTVNVFCDPELCTNQYIMSQQYRTEKKFSTPITMEKGDLFGEFNLGSTIVLVFEAPSIDSASDIISQFNSELIGSKIKYGENVLQINVNRS